MIENKFLFLNGKKRGKLNEHRRQYPAEQLVLNKKNKIYKYIYIYAIQINKTKICRKNSLEYYIGCV